MRRRCTLAIGLAASGCATRTPESAVAAFDPDTIPEGYAQSTAALMWPGATRAFQITPSGDLTNGEWRVGVLPRIGWNIAAPPRAIAYEERWRPIAHWRRANGSVWWEFEAVALPGPTRRDSGLVVSLLARATNVGVAPAEAELAMFLGPVEPLAPFVAVDETSGSAWPPRWASPRSSKLAHAWCADAAAAGDSLSVRWTLEPGASRELRVVLPAYPEPGRTLEEWGRTPHEQRAREARRYWDAEIARGLGLELHDPEVEAAVRAAEVVLLSCRERHGTRWLPIGSPFHYRDVWLRDGARAVQALTLAGYVDEAREAALGLTALAWPNGAYLSQRGQLDGTGQLLWAMGELWAARGAIFRAPRTPRSWWKR